MTQKTVHMFRLDEAAGAYALSAEHMFGNNDGFLDANPALVPIFVSHLFQSLEISIKHAGIESGLFTMKEARERVNRSGHGIKELATLAVERLGGDPFEPVVMAMTFANRHTRSASFIKAMICGDELEKTRESYASRRLGYGEVTDGDFALIRPVAEWIQAVKETAHNLVTTVGILTAWRESPSKSKHFAIWLKSR